MSRYNTQVLSSIRMLCRMQNIDEKVLYERAKLILSIYREVCWSTIDRANDVCDTLICTYGDSLDGALIYLENFAPDEARERFEERIRSLFETKWIIELVDMAMLKSENIQIKALCTVRLSQRHISTASSTGNQKCWRF